MALDEPRAGDEAFEQGDGLTVVVDRATYFYIDEPLRIDYDESERVYRIRSNSQIIPDKIRL
ncbi:iron-sulfur cluster biosynthesis family protein [Tumebacillus flagellatus]|uniref:Core domain-containing protein n=1 Tax=Tumebacillus flagellatus TaxID=1157490 RepID=A0A074LWQ7_9BACL|nr:iron-sulfur cluster biosynthesis family protein [Tumebacillus flagellatus]KEO84523.1 hypothetical protein EL26_03100 [Tumebacillus flagellatus]